MARQPGAGVLRAVLSAAATTRLTDSELLAQFLDGDETAFAALVKRHTRMVLGICRRMLPTVQDAEDACQATFLVLARKAKSGRWQSSIANWLYTTGRQIASKAKRAADRRTKHEANTASPAPPSTLDALTGREAFAALDEELDKLSPIYREPLVLCYLEGLTRDEAAARLSIPSATLKSQLDRGRKKLADALTQRGIDLGAALIAVAATSAEACAPRLIESILATISGSPSASVAAIAQGVAMNGLLWKSKLLALAAVVVTGVGLGLAAMPSGADPKKPVTAKAELMAAADDAKINSKSNVEQPTAKADAEPKYKPIDPETIAAYEKLGAEYGGFYSAISVYYDIGVWETYRFWPGKKAAAKGLPGFGSSQQSTWGRKGMAPLKLPPVDVSFGLDLNSSTLHGADLSELKNLKNLTLIDIGKFAGVTEAELMELKGFKNVTTLWLNSWVLRDASLMKELKDYKHLTSLELRFGFPDLKDKDLKELKELKNLTSLGLHSTKVTDEGLEEIKELNRITKLDLSITNVTDEGMRELKDLKRLTALNLSKTKVTDEGIKELSGLKNLATLSLAHLRLTDAGLKELKDCKNLTNLSLIGTRVRGVGLKEFRNLVLLDLRDTRVTDSAMEEIKTLSHLKELYLNGTQISDGALKRLQNLKSLTLLDLQDTQVTLAGVQELEDALPKCDIIVTKKKGNQNEVPLRAMVERLARVINAIHHERHKPTLTQQQRQPAPLHPSNPNRLTDSAGLLKSPSRS